MKNLPPRWVVWLLLTLVLAARVRSALMLGDRPDHDPDAYAFLADVLRSEGTFGLHRGPPVAGGGVERVPTAFRPPLYPLLLTPLATGDHDRFLTAVMALHLVLGGGTLWLIWLAAHQWRLTRGVALLAVLLAGIDPLLLRQSSEVMTETLATFLAVATLLALTNAASEDRSGGWIVVAGCALGLCILCRPTFLVWAVLVALRMLWRSAGARLGLRQAIALTIVCGAVVAPWIVRNYLHFGKFIAGTTHGGYTFLRSNNAFYYDHLRTQPWGTPWDSTPLDDQLLAVYRDAHLATDSGDTPQHELARDKIAYDRAWQAIQAQPGMFIYASLVRLERLFGLLPWQVDPQESWRGRGLRYGVGLFYGIEFLLAIVGAVSLNRRLFETPWVWGTLLLLSFAAVHSMYWTDMRMRAPLAPVIVLLAATGLCAGNKMGGMMRSVGPRSGGEPLTVPGD